MRQRAARLAIGLALALPACAIHPPDPTPDRDVAAGWHAPLPHDGDTAQVARWWERLGDPALTGLIDAAQSGSPNVRMALSRIDQARANAVAAGAMRVPSLDGRGQLQRAYSLMPPSIPYTLGLLALDASWEIDLFGRLRRTREAAVLRHEARVADWHDARVSLAADVATTYANLRLAESLLALYRQAAQSQASSATLTVRRVRAGFAPPADAALAEARSAEASDRVRAQQAQVELAVKALVVLTDLPEPELRRRLAGGTGRIPRTGALNVPRVPAQALAQRADLASLERELAAAAREVGVAQAERYPRISLAGSIGLMNLHAYGGQATGKSWSIGPALALPVFDAGRRQAGVERAGARFDELAAGYRARALAAVREVEEALVRLDAVRGRIDDMKRASDAYARYLAAAGSRYDNGTGTLFEQEEARRLSISAQALVAQLRAERVGAWIALYRAVGGGWQAERTTTLAAAPATGADGPATATPAGPSADRTPAIDTKEAARAIQR